ncbi:MAG: HRDC domain-containing protein [Coprobacillaceae bacterium]|nr:helicase [Coprobacillus sp. TF10-10]UYJ03173.1 MAG: HRDC domain-containing protein [Coprobacillaceae bacterium]
MLFKDKLKEPVIYKGSNKAVEELEQVQEYLKEHSDKDLEKKAKLIQYGIDGEKNILFELKNSHFPMYVLHDVYMVDHDLSAQIDYIIITPSMVYFIECKNLIGTIMIDAMGNFTREYTYNGKIIKEGIYSPITQSQRHLDLYKSLRAKRQGTVMKFIYDKTFSNNFKSLVVLANPKSILKSRYAPKEIKDKVIKADQLIDYIKRHEQSAFRNQKDMIELVDIFLSYHQDKEIQSIQKENNSVIEENNDSLIEQLKNYRLTKAKEKNLPPYYVFNDETLNEIISIKPQTIDELLTVKGFGQKKCEWYGNDILQIIRSL